MRETVGDGAVGTPCVISPATPVQHERDRRRWRRVAVGSTLALVFVVGLVAVTVAGIAARRFTRNGTPHERDVVEHFKYGSIGSEPESGLPYWVWKALPSLFP